MSSNAGPRPGDELREIHISLLVLRLNVRRRLLRAANLIAQRITLKISKKNYDGRFLVARCKSTLWEGFYSFYCCVWSAVAF